MKDDTPRNAVAGYQNLLLSSCSCHCVGEQAIALRHSDRFVAPSLKSFQGSQGSERRFPRRLVVVLSSAFPHVVHRRGAAGQLGSRHPFRDHAGAEIVCVRRKLLAPSKQTSKRQDQAQTWAV